MPPRNARQRRNRRCRRRRYRYNKAHRSTLAKALPFAAINDIDFFNTIEFPLASDLTTAPWPDTYLLPYRCFMEDEELNEEDIPLINQEFYTMYLFSNRFENEQHKSI